MDDCVFCKIINNELESRVVFENEATLVIVAKAIDVPGHLLLLPKSHFNSFIDVDVITAVELQKTLLKLTNHLVNNCGYAGINILNASGIAADQSVPHLHIHIIPRKIDDGINAWPVFNDDPQATSDELFAKLQMKS